MKEMLPGDSSLFKSDYKPSDLVDLAMYDLRMTEIINGKPLIRNIEARKEYEMRAFALRLAAYVLWAHKLGYLEFKS